MAKIWTISRKSHHPIATFVRFDILFLQLLKRFSTHTWRTGVDSKDKQWPAINKSLIQSQFSGLHISPPSLFISRVECSGSHPLCLLIVRYWTGWTTEYCWRCVLSTEDGDFWQVVLFLCYFCWVSRKLPYLFIYKLTIIFSNRFFIYRYWFWS